MRNILRGAVTLALILPFTAGPVKPAAALAVTEERVYVETTVDSDHNGRPDRVAIDIARTTGATNLPVVFEHSPYRSPLNNAPNHNVNVDRLPQEDLFGIAGSSPRIDAARAVPDLPGWYDDYFLSRGYAVVLGHSIGTGDSEGCPTSGDMQETLGTTAVIDWLNGRARGYNAAGAQVTASWSNGNVGMIGISYNGTLPNMAAATGVPGLKAIVPIAAISSWYDYYRANGLVVAPGGYQGEDADVLANAVVKRTGCTDEIAAIAAAQDRNSGDYTQFWRDRDYVKDVANVSAAVFVIHGQTDWNVKSMQYAQWYEALRQRNHPRKIWLHRGGHGTASRTDYQSTVGRWFDRYVKGIANGIDTEPKADVQAPDGTWRTYGDFPDPQVQNTVFYLGSAGGVLSPTPTSGNVNQSFVDNGRSLTAEQLAASPDSANPNRLIYRTAALASAVRLSGTPRVTLRAAVDNRKDANLTALLVDYSGSTPTIVTRGWLDPQNRNGTAGQPLEQGQEYTMTFSLQPRDYVFAAGRRIGLVVISTDYNFTLRPLSGTQLHVNPALSSLSLPLVSAPSGSTCTGYESTYSGTLSSGGNAYQPSFQTTITGSHRACLDGPAGADFDLYLQKWNGSAWTTVASGTTSAADESFTYNGTAGTYRYRVHAYSGSGSYSGGYDAP
ncbi:Xaa-Pro dipeptidyl-peptidase [Catelliglobosispora koreensis]|uniref:Xaa-Pro dipeptidyl-peptidase n=1 Tax=Catelliglobosispora koreensis TaxID=129052 RepID=UPI00037A1B77|nr:Xaa-Pro dipeptidyl-peptidase [Catelliglobosispora koreensis]